MTRYEEALALELETADPSAPDWRDSRAYRLWRIVVIQRDRKCVICGSKTNRHAHHVDHATYFVDKRFDAANGVTLCGDCHMNLHCNFHRSYRTKCDEYNFMNFVKLSCHFHGMWRECAEDTMDPDWPSLEDADLELTARCNDSLYVKWAFDKSPDSVVGYVTELFTMRYPEALA